MARAYRDRETGVAVDPAGDAASPAGGPVSPRWALVSCPRSPRGPPTPSAEDDRWIPNSPLRTRAARPRPRVSRPRRHAPVRRSRRAAPRRPPPGLKAQLGAVRIALLGFVRAHIDLAKAEIEEVRREVGRACGLAAAAIACLILMSLLVAIGGMLFTGEWIFGSIGWGVLLGAELLIAVALTLVLVALYVPGLGRDVALAVLPGIAVALILGLNLPNELFRRSATPPRWPWIRPSGRSSWAWSSSGDRRARSSGSCSA